MTTARQITRELHPGAPSWTAAERRSLHQIGQAADQVRRGGNRDLIPVAITRHVDDLEVKAATIERISRAKPWTEIADPVAAADALDLRSLPKSKRTGRWHLVPKGNGDFRLVCSLSWHLRVGHMLVKDALIRCHVPGDHIGDWRGRGPVYHLRRTCEDLQNGSVVLVADVQNCFPTVSPDAVYGLGVLPSDLVESCFDSRRIRLRAPSYGQWSSNRCMFERTGRQGLLSGGAASSFLWAMMINDLPNALPAGVRANTYVDNVVIICRSTQECEEAEAALIRYFTEHPAGPFFLKTALIDAEAGFDHLGYGISVGAEGVAISLKDARLPGFGDRVRNIIAKVDGPITESGCESIAHTCLSPWPMLTLSSRDALIEEIRHECRLHNQRRRLI